MTTRQNVPYRDDKGQVDTGYDTLGNDASTFYVPSCGIEDVDIAVHTLFNEDIKFQTRTITTNTNEQVNLRKPFVMMATGERFAMAKRMIPFRDRNGALILPAISIRRTNIEQQGSELFHGELKIKRRFDSSDNDYQKLLNALNLKNMQTPPSSTRGDAGFAADEASLQQGMLLDDEPNKLRTNHVYEIITIPFPQLFTATYEVVFWSTYIQHMNYLIDTLLSNQIAPGKGFYLKTNKGYWFGATLDNTLTAQDNFDDITDSERVSKYSFTMTVKGYLLAPQGEGQRVPFKRYLSAPSISFDVSDPGGDGIVGEKKDDDNFNETKNGLVDTNPFILTDLELDPATTPKPTVQQKRVYGREYVDRNGNKKTRLVTQTSRYQKNGETVYTASDEESLMEFFNATKK